MPKQLPQAHAPNSASARASRSCGSATIRGSARASRDMASAASDEVIGLLSFAYKASTACAIALMPDTTERRGGRVIVSSTSYTTTSGRIFGERIVVFLPCSV